MTRINSKSGTILSHFLQIRRSDWFRLNIRKLKFVSLKISKKEISLIWPELKNQNMTRINSKSGTILSHFLQIRQSDWFRLNIRKLKFVSLKILKKEISLIWPELKNQNMTRINSKSGTILSHFLQIRRSDWFRLNIRKLKFVSLKISKKEISLIWPELKNQNMTRINSKSGTILSHFLQIRQSDWFRLNIRKLKFVSLKILKKEISLIWPELKNQNMTRINSKSGTILSHFLQIRRSDWFRLNIRKLKFVSLKISKKEISLIWPELKNQNMTRINSKSGTILSHFLQIRQSDWFRLNIRKLKFVSLKILKKEISLIWPELKNQNMTRINSKSGTILSHFLQIRRSDWFRLNIRKLKFVSLKISKKEISLIWPELKNQNMTRINSKSGTILSHFLQIRQSDWFRLNIRN